MDRRLVSLFIIIIFSFLCGCPGPSQDAKQHLYPAKQTLVLNDSLNTIVFENFASEPVSFLLKINELFPLSLEIILSQVKQTAELQHISHQQAAWYYVVHHTFHSQPLTTENWQHSPEIFLNSAGGGFCDDRASVLAYIWKAMGDSVRVIGLNGHVVPEVFMNNKWQMYDPDNGVFYCDAMGRVLSVDELERQPGMVSDPHAFCSSAVNRVFNAANPVAERFAGYYSSSEDNKDVSDWHTPAYELSPEINLPSNSTLKLILNSQKQPAGIVVQLSGSSKGSLKLPFVPYQSKGKLEFIYNKKQVRANAESFSFPLNTMVKEITIESAEENTRIYYLVNPRIDVFNDTNFIELSSSLPLNISIQNSDETNIQFAEAYLFFDTIQQRYPYFYEKITPPGNGIDLTDYLLKQYTLFLREDSLLSQNEIRQMTNLMKEDINAMSAELKQTKHTDIENLVRENYPKSIFYLFTASRYRKMDYLAKTL